MALAVVVAALLFFVTSSASAAAGQRAPTPFDRVLTVGFDATTDPEDRARVRADAGVQARRALAAPGLQQVIVPEGMTLAAAAARLRAAGGVDFVQLPGHFEATALTNDPYVVYQNVWGLNNLGLPFACSAELVGGVCPPGSEVAGTADADIDAPEAWDVLNGGAEPVAVVDSGVAWQHQDLAANIWTNLTESAGVSSLDDDPYVGFGGVPRSYVDDVHGWDFVGDLVSPGVRLPPDGDPADPVGHGTHVAGTVGAVGNNAKGIAGVNPGAKIMPLRAADENGLFSFGAIEEAFTYAIDHGVRVINGSFSGPSSAAGVSAIIAANPEVLFVFAAGNGGRDHDGGDGRQYPCDDPSPNVICVAATDWNDQLAAFSDHGAESVDVAAPGRAILSTVPSDSDPAAGGDYDYAFLDGTSMAAPHVAGAASLVWSANPALVSSQVKSLLLLNADLLVQLSDKVAYLGRLNLARAINEADSPPPPGWPVPPESPRNIIDDPVPPPGDSPPAITDTQPPALQLDKVSTIGNGKRGTLKFGVTCDEQCKIVVKARTKIRGLRTVTTRTTGNADQVRRVIVRYRGKALARLRAALRRKGKVVVRVTVSVTDAAGNTSIPRRFRITMVR